VRTSSTGRSFFWISPQCREEEWRGSGTVLLVDDEETVREIGAEMLKEFGFQVITDGDGQEGIDILKVTPGIAFVILDQTMPHLDGEQCFRELRKLAPGVKVIMTSGYNGHEVTQKFVGKGLAGFLRKPCTVSELKNMIVSLELA
jgi:DNA-binding NtrC family response regulator